ncbi:hypothetical protein GDO86_002187 [Hymenochirus boettgeri]|uniref:Uncharacterized protein n=1 Tax=Hymenochirus boettgeri TaxID=247094 RepID=A0A8T2KIF6_9PIPI|nr:hypothetical protein GDO86_002187 [Hymenochirus boettgeri]
MWRKNMLKEQKIRYIFTAALRFVCFFSSNKGLALTQVPQSIASICGLQSDPFVSFTFPSRLLKGGNWMSNLFLFISQYECILTMLNLCLHCQYCVFYWTLYTNADQRQFQCL